VVHTVGGDRFLEIASLVLGGILLGGGGSGESGGGFGGRAPGSFGGSRRPEMAQQSILGRIGQLARANIHALLDAAEDPEKMRDQMVRDYTAWMDQHLADDVVWHVGGNSKWAGAYQGKQKVLEYFGRQAQATGGPTSVEIHDVLGNDEHVEVHPAVPYPGREGDPGLGEWPRTTPRSTRSWTVFPADRAGEGSAGPTTARATGRRNCIGERCRSA
jgi:ketosteroid isomerase-like protein